MKNPTKEAARLVKLRRMYDKDLAQHEITSRQIVGAERALFILRRPGESNFCAEVCCLAWGTLMVHGDVETAVFSRCSYTNWEAKLGWMRGHSYDYAQEKLSIGTGCRAMAYCFDEEVAQEQIVYWRRQKYIDADTAREAQLLVRNGEHHEARSVVASANFELDLGMTVDSRVVMALAVVTKLCELLDAEEAAARAERPIAGVP